MDFPVLRRSLGDKADTSAVMSYLSRLKHDHSCIVWPLDSLSIMK
jgi:hypothetical protein